STEAVASDLMNVLKEEPKLQMLRNANGTFAVEIGPFSTRQEAVALQDRLSSELGFVLTTIRQQSVLQTPEPSGVRSTPVDLPPATPAVDAKKAELANYRAAAEKAESENR